MTQHLSGTSATDAVWDWDLAAGRMHVSPRWCALVGAAATDAGTTRDTWLDRVHPADLGAVTQTIDAHLSGDAAAFDVPHRLRHADGGYRWTACRITVHRDAAGHPLRLSAVQADVTAATVTDPQTGLPNALLLDEHLERSIERARRYEGFHFALLIVGVDGAAPAGRAESSAVDPLLAAAARRLETCVRSAERPRSMRHDDLVARLDGDRFALLLDGLKDVSHVTLVADRVLAELRKPFALRTGEVFAAASVGIAVSATGYVRAEDVRRDAEIALHRARLLGGGRAEVFDVAVLHAARTELQLESEFQDALDRSEFQVYYQPIVALAATRLVGFEALVRWQHPVLGLVAPADFIPLAERTGFIVPLGRWVLQTACARLSAWRREHPEAEALWISVNVSTAQVEEPGFGGDVEAALAAAGIPAAHLVLEITESLAVERPAAVRGVLMQLRGLGVRLSVDDFGTGQSSLASLQQLPVDALKTDRAFVRGIESRREAPEILRTVLHMAQQLGLQVVAEGLETPAQLETVRELGVEYGQGYVFAPALAEDVATRLLLDGVPKVVSAKPARVGRRTGTPLSRYAWAARLWQHANAPATRLLAAAAALLLVIVGGLAAGVLDDLVPAAGGAAVLPATQMALAAPSSATAAAPPATFPAAARRREAVPEAPVAAPARGSSAPASSATPSGTPTGASVEVLHQHRIGGCRGRLMAVRGGVRFVPDDGDDAFELAPGQFLHELDAGVLTVRSNDRTYRFRPVDAADRAGGDSRFRSIVSALGRRP